MSFHHAGRQHWGPATEDTEWAVVWNMSKPSSRSFQAHVGLHIQSFIFIYIHLYSFIFIYIHLYSFIFIYIHLYSFIFIYIHVYSCIFMHVYSLIFMYIHVYSFIFIYIHLLLTTTGWIITIHEPENSCSPFGDASLNHRLRRLQSGHRWAVTTPRAQRSRATNAAPMAAANWKAANCPLVSMENVL